MADPRSIHSILHRPEVGLSLRSPKPEITLSLALSPSPAVSPPEQGLKPEERGIRLIQLLLICAKHASSGNLHRADECLRQISQLASISGDSMQRLATRFASALAVRLVKRWPGLYKALNLSTHQWAKQELVRAKPLFSQAFPYLLFAYAIITQTLLQTMAEERMIHIVDLGSIDAEFWVPLLRSFSRLQNGTPYLKITCVNNDKTALENLRQRLVKEAESLDMPFQFNPINTGLTKLTTDMLSVRTGEALAFISVLKLHELLAEDDRVDAHFGGRNNIHNAIIKDCRQMGQFLSSLRSMSPKVLFLVEQEADHNQTRLVDRFVEGLHYYSAVFDSIDATLAAASEERVVLEEMFGREIENIVACEGVEREERHERYARWMARFGQVGFKPVRMWFDAMEDARKMVETCGREGYKIVDERASLMICWHDRPLYAVSAWTC